MKSLKLAEIIKCVNSGSEVSNDDLFVSGISTDSREDLKGKLYIALEGDKFDGHDFIDQAIKKGAVAVITHKDVDIEVDNLIRVKNTKQALIDIATYYRSLFDIKIIGVTGSVGKTSTKDMISTVLGQRYRVLKTEANLNNEIGVSKTILSLNDDYDVAVIEMGMCSFGEISELSNIIKPNIGVVTKIGVSHIEALGSRENILKAKLEIIDGMKKESLIVLNGDDDLLTDYNNENFMIERYGIYNKNSDVIAKNINSDFMETCFNIVDKDKILDAKIPCMGKHNIYNALAAYLIGRNLNLTDKEILNGLELYYPSGMRQKVVNFKGVTIVEDCYNANPDSMKAAIKTIREMDVKGEKIMVISDMLELGDISVSSHYDVGRMIADSDIDKIYCFGELSRQYVNGALDGKMKKENVKFFSKKDDVYKSLKDDIKRNNVIWFKASRGMKLEEIIEKIYNNSEK